MFALFEIFSINHFGETFLNDGYFSVLSSSQNKSSMQNQQPNNPLHVITL